MRFIKDDNDRLLYVSFGADISCDGQDCMEYTGEVPEGYASLESWYIIEQEHLYRWKIIVLPVLGTMTLALDPDAAAPVEKWHIPLNEFVTDEYMQFDQAGYRRVEPFYNSSGEAGLLIYNEDKVYILQFSSEGLLLRYYCAGEFTDYILDGSGGSGGSTGVVGPQGEPGEDGVGVASVEQAYTSDDDEGENVIRVTLTNGEEYFFVVKNGSKGSTGATGPQGPQGEQGEAGGYYKPTVTQVDEYTAKMSFSPVGVGLAEVLDQRFSLPPGPQGEKGADAIPITTAYLDDDGHLQLGFEDGHMIDCGQAQGENGVSCTHSWNGTMLTVTSASGTTSADLKGDKGDKGDTGETGPAGGGANSIVAEGEPVTMGTVVYNVGDFWFDSSGPHLYICTASSVIVGATRSYTWTQIV